jgi:type IV pilus assembly protein PilC
MEEYTYTVVDKKGATKRGIVQSTSPKQAAAALHERGFTIVSIEPKKKGLGTIRIFGGIGIGVLSQFTRQLATMITSGLPLADSLAVLQKQTENQRMQEVTASISEEIEGGNSFSSALGKHEDVFSPAYINMIKAGEASGTLDKVLLKLANTLERQREFQGKVKGALVYPAIIVVAMLLVAAIILIFVVPKLTEVYTDMNIALPLPTRILITVSDFMVKFWWLMIILSVVGVMALRRYKKTQEGALVIDKLLLKIPVIGKLNRDSSLAEFTRTLGSLVAAGVPIIESLKISGDTAGNAIHRLAVSNVVNMVEKGATLSKALAKEETFPPIVPQMSSVGEETGKMDEVLGKVAHYFEVEVEQQVKNLTTALEPIIMIILGIMVALLMVSIILPIYSITAAF